MGGVHNNKTCKECNKSSSRNLLCKIGIHNYEGCYHTRPNICKRENCNAEYDWSISSWGEEVMPDGFRKRIKHCNGIIVSKRYEGKQWVVVYGVH